LAVRKKYGKTVSGNSSFSACRPNDALYFSLPNLTGDFGKRIRGVSPLRVAGLLCCASNRCQKPNVSPLTGCQPSRALAATKRAARA